VAEQMRARKTGGQVNESTGKVERGRMPKGSVEDATVIYDGPFAALRRRADRKRQGW
jgi:hypothetical protein